MGVGFSRPALLFGWWFTPGRGGAACDGQAPQIHPGLLKEPWSMALPSTGRQSEHSGSKKNALENKSLERIELTAISVEQSLN